MAMKRPPKKRRVVSAPPDFALLFSSNPLPMWIYDRETLSIVAANAAAGELLSPPPTASGPFPPGCDHARRCR